MQKAGGIIAIVAGVFGVVMAFITLLVGGIGSAFEAKEASTVVNLGWGGVFFSFLVIVLGAVSIGTRKIAVGISLILSSIAGAILGGVLVAIFMVLALVAGIFVTIGIGKANQAQELSR